MKSKNIPRLRFPEFRDAPEWEQLPIGKKVDLLSGYPFKSEEISEDESGIPLMRGINITEGYIRHSREIDRFFLGNAQKLEKFILQTNDLVIGMDGSKVGKNSALVTANDSGSLLIQRVARLRAECKATIEFIYQHINSIKFHQYVDRINTSSGIPHISAKQINEFEISFPKDKKEQQKIADCLMSLDDLIADQSAKAEALKKQKKALIQQLFPREGESVPRLRFPEFRDAPEWEEKKLSDLLDYEQPTNYLVSDTNYNNNFEIPVLTAGKTFILGYTNELNGVFDNPLPVIIFDDFTTATQFVDFPFKAKSSAMKILKSKGYFANIKVIFELMQNIRFQAEEHKRYWISEYQNIEIKIPKPNEQQKIADCLTSLDDLISAQNTKIEALKAHKKALMQQLFPSNDEVEI